ncbi:MAG: hypothetical protein ACYCW6_29625, partial [Candidatus Xenobia bacterium]
MHVTLPVALPALAWQFLAWVGMAAVYQAGLRTAGIECRLTAVMPMLLGAVYRREVSVEPAAQVSRVALKCGLAVVFVAALLVRVDQPIPALIAAALLVAAVRGLVVLLSSVAVASRPAGLAAAVGLGLVAQALHLLTLSRLLAATDQPASAAALCGVLALGLLIRRPGLADAGMLAGAVALGIPPSPALFAVGTYRALSFWLPSGLGWWLIARTPRHAVHRRAGELSVRVLSILTALVGFMNLFSGVQPAVHSRLMLLAPYLPLALRHGSRLAAVLTGFLLLRLARHLWHRKRVAWILTMLALGVSAVTHLLKAFDYPEAALAAGLALWLFLLRAEFHARSDPPSVRQGLSGL